VRPGAPPSDVSEIRPVFSISPERPAANFAANWNVAPTDSLPIVRWDARSGERSLDLMRWGLAPYFCEDMVAWPVDQRVGNVKNNDPLLIEPVAELGLTTK
jgi:putative SOS response-associated peptidase YedK